MNEGTPVAAGLAIGVTFIVAFSWAASLGTLPPSSSQEDARYFALKITRDLDEVKEFFGIYPNASTTVYFITTCAYERCSTLQRISSVVEYWYKAEDQKYAQLRVTIDYEEGKATFSQISCTIYGTEYKGVGIYGTIPLGRVAEFLQDSHCPKPV